MLEKISSLGTTLNKTEQKVLFGGGSTNLGSCPNGQFNCYCSNGFGSGGGICVSSIGYCRAYCNTMGPKW